MDDGNTIGDTTPSSMDRSQRRRSMSAVCASTVYVWTDPADLG